VKTRISHTKVWQDGWFREQEDEVKLYFLYLLTNEYMGIAYFQEVAPSTESSETGLELEKLKEIKKKMAEDGKITCYKDYLYLSNGYKYANYSGIKNDHLKLRTLFEMSDDVLVAFKIAVLKTISEIKLDLKTSKNKDEKFGDKVLNLMARLEERLNVLGMVDGYADRGMPIEGRIQNTEIRKQNNNTNTNTNKDIVVSVNPYQAFKDTWKQAYGKYPTGGKKLVDFPIKRLVEAYSIEKVCNAIIWAETNRGKNKFIPVFNNPLELEKKWNTLVDQARKEKNGVNKRGFVI